MKCLKLAALVFTLGIFSLSAQAALISFDPSAQSVNLSDAVSVDIRISGLGDDIVTAFDLDIVFDASILGFTGFTYGNDLDVLGLGSITSTFDFGGGVVNVFELSLDFDEDLMLFQPNDFVLGTMTFDSLAVGTSALSLTNHGVAGEFVFDPSCGCMVASELDITLQSGEVRVIDPDSPTGLTEPSTLGLALLGMLSVLGMRRRKMHYCCMLD